jgi:putative CocE/NonD family hydrolase
MMKIVDDFEHSVEESRNVWIPMADGTRLAARIWLPKAAHDTPVPAILEYIPYRKTDRTSARDAVNHAFFAGNGYASLRVDLRGSGDSDGVLTDEYLEQELVDGEATLAWIAEQSWCNGRVGMIGISWGGFNGLQLAARRPPELAAVITVCSTDDRYADDVHFMGGCMLGDNLSWASYMFAINTLPPHLEHVGEDWRAQWHERLEYSGLWLDTWLRHQHRDDYWKHGSICEDFDAVQVPILAVSGWADGYSNAVFRLVEHLDSPVRGLVGPWSHTYPHMGRPGPAIGFLDECVRWWDHWLKGEDRGVDNDPALRAWMQDSVPPTTRYKERPGRWVGEASWPPAHDEAQVWDLTPGGLIPSSSPSSTTSAPPDAAADGEALSICSPLSTGLFAGKWCSYSAGPDLPHDQRQEDGGALVFDTEPLEEAVEILGMVELDLTLSSDEPVALIAARLSDIDPKGKATRVTYGLLNLTHRDGHEHPEALEPGRRYRVRVQLNNVAQRFPAGHRIRLALSTSYWPLAWPPPREVTLDIVPAGSRLRMPVRRPRPEDDALRPFAPPSGAAPATVTRLEPAHHNWLVTRDLENDVSTLTVVKDEGRVLYEDVDLEVFETTTEWYSSCSDEFGSVRGEVVTEIGVQRGDWQLRTRTRTVLTSTETHFHLRAELDAFEGDIRVHSHNWDRKIPRRLV